MGKLYNVLALEMAQAIVKQVTAVRLAQVFILSQIGQPLDQPFIATAMVQPTGEDLDQHTIREVEMVMDDCLNQINRLREKIIDGEIPLY